MAGAFMWTAPFPVFLTAMPAEAVAPLVRLLADLRPAPSKVNVPAGDAADVFAAAWRRHTGGAITLDERQRLYRLGTLTPPRPGPPGRARLVIPADRDLLLAWHAAFTEEIRGEAVSVEDVERTVDERTVHGELVLWEVDGVPVAMAGRTRVVAEMARVTSVYTPPRSRRRGYAAAVTAAASRAAQQAGARQVVLFTDLANPTSNGVYRRIGYRPVEDRVLLRLG